MVCKIAPLYRLSGRSHMNSFTGCIFRRCLHGHLAALRKLAQLHQDSVSSNFQYEVHAHRYILTYFPARLYLSPAYCHCHILGIQG
ncbi:Peroxisomal (S)-2-hydroxy-acid oxidase GLO1 [Zea mays]|uniref:Peroxisomal (S)-2-hydroxy-acid oxidase GLO1 n=1 Tax=Zea mays TaxID=4577 RepID=A0A1D6DYT9_MAIZE|nr:Peroxisomal (S)-2-hydroxy-acid oxidase GLO1 [Zea mays]